MDSFDETEDEEYRKKEKEKYWDPYQNGEGNYYNPLRQFDENYKRNLDATRIDKSKVNSGKKTFKSGASSNLDKSVELDNDD